MCATVPDLCAVASHSISISLRRCLSCITVLVKEDIPTVLFVLFVTVLVYLLKCIDQNRFNQ